MPVRSVKIEVQSSLGTPIVLAGILDLPEQQPIATAVFAHCFTCTKDIKAAARISRFLSGFGIAVLRFDFRGLGRSEGVFADSNLFTNLDDIRAAVAFVTREIAAPKILLGHSLGGAAMMAIAGEFPSAEAIVTLASPSDTNHLVETLLELNPAIESEGQGEVVIGGVTHHVKKQMLDVLSGYDLPARIRQLTLPHLIFHSLTDETVSFAHARRVFQWTGGSKLLVTLGDSDHLFVNHPGEVKMIAGFINTWYSSL